MKSGFRAPEFSALLLNSTPREFRNKVAESQAWRGFQLFRNFGTAFFRERRLNKRAFEFKWTIQATV